MVIPPDRPRFKQKTGVITGTGEYVSLAETRRHGATLTQPPEVNTAAAAILPGTWLWAGSLYDHFGHFLIESCARLWRWSQLEQSADGILFVPKFPNRMPGLRPFQQAIIDAWGMKGRVQVITEAATVEHLLVGEQSIGLGDRIAATEEMRRTAKTVFGREVQAEGPERLYISRSKLPVETGALLAEPEIEAALKENGYEIFHPQDHDINTQIARYKAARYIVVADGSPGHLIAYCATAAQRIAYLPRRAQWLDGPIDHIAAFHGERPTVLPAPTREWLPKNPKAFRNVSYCWHDLPAIGAALSSAGFGSSGTWSNPDERTIGERINGSVLTAEFSEA